MIQIRFSEKKVGFGSGFFLMVRSGSEFFFRKVESGSGSTQLGSGTLVLTSPHNEYLIYMVKYLLSNKKQMVFKSSLNFYFTIYSIALREAAKKLVF